MNFKNTVACLYISKAMWGCPTRKTSNLLNKNSVLTSCCYPACKAESFNKNVSLAVTCNISSLEDIWAEPNITLREEKPTAVSIIFGKFLD